MDIVAVSLPNRRPAVFTEILLIFRMQKSQATRRHFAEFVIIDAQVVHAPVGKLVCVVQL